MKPVEDRICAALSELLAVDPEKPPSLTAVAELAKVSLPTLRKYVGGREGLRVYIADHDIASAEAVRDTPERILEAALKVFAEKGYIGATVDHVAEAAGLTKGAVYHHYANKQALLLALMERRFEQQIEIVERVSSSISQWDEEGLERILIGVLDAYAAEEGWFELYHEVLTQLRDPETFALYQKQEAYVLSAFKKIVKGIQKKGDARNDVDPTAIFLIIAGAMERFSLMLQADMKPRPSNKIVRDMARIIYRGAGNFTSG